MNKQSVLLIFVQVPRSDQGGDEAVWINLRSHLHHDRCIRKAPDVSTRREFRSGVPESFQDAEGVRFIDP
jgi:hypothetical protein